MSCKYELTDEIKRVRVYESYGNYKMCKLHRIRALKDFANVKKGDLGGFVESENNLSEEGTCWIYDDACVYGNAQVYHSATVSGTARVYDYARIYHYAQISENARIYDRAEIYGSANIHGNASISSIANIHSNVEISGNTHIYGAVHVCGNSFISGDNLYIHHNMSINGNAYITSEDDFCLIISFGLPLSNNITFFRCINNNIGVDWHGFKGTLDEFRIKIQKEYKDSQYTKEYLMLADLMEVRFNK